MPLIVVRRVNVLRRAKGCTGNIEIEPRRSPLSFSKKLFAFDERLSVCMSRRGRYHNNYSGYPTKDVFQHEMLFLPVKVKVYQELVRSHANKKYRTTARCLPDPQLSVADPRRPSCSARQTFRSTSLLMKSVDTSI